MASPRKVLVVGGGLVGNSVTILLRKAGSEVRLVEADPTWGAVGSGIMLQGNALTVLREVGVWDELSRYVAILPGPGTNLVLGDPDLPPGCGAYRPKLQGILTRAVLASGADVRLGVTFETIHDAGDGIDVTFTDGSSDHYDLLIGADGIRSKTRAAIGHTTTPTGTGLGIWRAYSTRPAEVDTSTVQHGKPHLISGYTPTGPDNLYAFIVERVREPGQVPPVAEWDAEFRRLAEPLTGAWPEIVAGIKGPEQMNYTPFEWLLLDRPWPRGRAILVGDAMHACPPTLAQGAAMGLEDASVLVRELQDNRELGVALNKFEERRYNRIRTVVTTSVAICDALKEGKQSMGTYFEVFKALAEKP